MVYKREPLTTDEEDKMVNVCETFKERLVVCSLLDTGMRVSELCHMDKDNIKWERRSVVIWGKRKKRREIPFTRRVKDLWDMAITSSILTKQGIEFGKRRGKTYKTVERIVSALGVKAGIDKQVTPHVLRHTFAVRSIINGLSVVALQKILGHGDLKSTMIYLNMCNEDAIEEYRRKIG